MLKRFATWLYVKVVVVPALREYAAKMEDEDELGYDFVPEFEPDDELEREINNIRVH